MASGTLIVDTPNWGGIRRFIRLVNSTPSKVIFTLAIDDMESSDSSKISIDPKMGILEPFGFSIISLQIPTTVAKYPKINLVYKRLGITRYEPPRIKRTIQFVTKGLSENLRPVSIRYIFILLRIIRTLILLTLITYNVILIVGSRL